MKGLGIYAIEGATQAVREAVYKMVGLVVEVNVR